MPRPGITCHGRQRPRRENRQEEVEKIYPLPAKVSRCVQGLGNFFNFGLYFNKWLWVVPENLGFEYKFQAKPKKKVLTKREEREGYQADKILAHYERLKNNLNKFLTNRHEAIDTICQAFKKLGYEALDKTYKLKTSLIIGLGNAHPTERGFTFHWTLGIPYIPAESIKGVVRLAYLVNKAQQEPNFFEHWAKEDEAFWAYLAELFGRVEKEKSTQRGKVIFLDALPVGPPTLTLEITTCHYPDYYGGKRGPTEDQNPNPLPFLAVAPGALFRFVFLMDEALNKEVKEKFVKAFEAALSDHGFGAKTALGHGRF